MNRNSHRRPQRTRWPMILTAGVALMFAGIANIARADWWSWLPSGPIEIQTLSSLKDFVSGGDVLVRIQLPQNVDPQRVQVSAAGKDVSGAFKPGTQPNTLVGLVGGLALGKSSITVRARDWGNIDAAVEVTNYPITGPIVAGPLETPFICETNNFAFPDGTKPLGDPIDANCSIATRVDYFYRSTANTWKPLTSLTQYPTDLANTVTIEGKTVPFIIRMETGTVDRAIYQTAMLDDPKSGRTPGLFQRSSSWNGRLVYQFGGGCTGGWYRQGSSTGGVTDTVILGMGYAMASSTLNVFGNNCNDLSTSEALMMTKERFIKAYGLPDYTIGFGCSGGSYQQHQAADNYPGLLDGIIPGCSFPEVGFATVHSITDARLIANYFKTTALPWSDEQKRQVVGFFGLVTMTTSTVFDGALRISPTAFCPAVLPANLRYNSATNPGGARCDVYDHAVNVYGRDPVTKFALRPIDNVGIQYGLAALKAGTITMDQFLDLNEKVGGYDVDGNFRTARTIADIPAVRAAYRSGRLTNGGGGLRDIPIIDYRGYADDDPAGNIHLRYHSFSMRERLKKANGDADNQIMVVEDIRYGLYSSASPLLQFALRKMDQWIANIRADAATSTSVHQKVVRNKPADLLEGCNTRDTNPTFVAEKQTRDPSIKCEKLYPSSPAPREVAGANVASDIIKCQLRPLSLTDYPGTPTVAQVSRLQNVFPTGACDWGKAGIEQQPLAGVWQTF